MRYIAKQRSLLLVSFMPALLVLHKYQLLSFDTNTFNLLWEVGITRRCRVDTIFFYKPVLSPFLMSQSCQAVPASSWLHSNTQLRSASTNHLVKTPSPCLCFPMSTKRLICTDTIVKTQTDSHWTPPVLTHIFPLEATLIPFLSTSTTKQGCSNGGVSHMVRYTTSVNHVCTGAVWETIFVATPTRVSST